MQTVTNNLGSFAPPHSVSPPG